MQLAGSITGQRTATASAYDGNNTGDHSAGSSTVPRRSSPQCSLISRAPSSARLYYVKLCFFNFFLRYNISKTAEPIFTKSSRKMAKEKKKKKTRKIIEKKRKEQKSWFLNSFGGGGEVENVTFSAVAAGLGFTKSRTAAKRIHLSKKRKLSNFLPDNAENCGKIRPRTTEMIFWCICLTPGYCLTEKGEFVSYARWRYFIIHL